MADKKVEFEIKVIGDALERLRQITGQTEDLGNAAMKAKSKLASIGGAFIAANQALEFVKKATSPAGIPGQSGGGIDGPGLGAAANDSVAKGAEAAVTGGTRNTTVNINLGKMVENIVFNGTLGENAQDLENKIQEILTRTLMMAAATA